MRGAGMQLIDAMQHIAVPAAWCDQTSQVALRGSRGEHDPVATNGQKIALVSNGLGNR
jgi:hypothetical protein